jgi:hypothetical protein
MSTVITTHPTRDQRQFFTADVDGVAYFMGAVAKGRPVDALVDVIHSAMGVVGYGAAINAPHDQILDAFRIAAQAGAALFDLAVHPNADRSYTLAALPVTLRTESAHGQTLPIEWLDEYSAACAVRDHASARQLAEVHPDVVLRSMRVMRYDECQRVLVEGLGALHLNDPHARALLLRARELAGPEHATVAPEWAKRVGRPLAELALRIAEGEPGAFNAALATAVQQHKAYWGKNVKLLGLSRRDWHEGIVARWLLGLACLAHDRGIPIDVESDYIPAWIIRRDT